jgi:hypothetical protein
MGDGSPDHRIDDGHRPPDHSNLFVAAIDDVIKGGWTLSHRQGIKCNVTSNHDSGKIDGLAAFQRGYDC